MARPKKQTYEDQEDVKKIQEQISQKVKDFELEKEKEVISKTEEQQDAMALQLHELMKEIQEQKENNKKIQEEIERLKSSPSPSAAPVIYASDQEKKFGTSQRREIPEGDRLDKPSTFLMRGRGFILSVYRKDGTEVYAPYDRPIRFMHTSTDTRSGQATDTLHFSSYSTWSKKEVDFIKNCPLFGSLIFDTVSKAMAVNPAIQSALQQASNHVETMTDDMVFNVARSYGIDLHLPMPKIKEQVRTIKLQEILEQEDIIDRGVKERLSGTLLPG